MVWKCAGVSTAITFRCSLAERSGFSRDQDGGVLRLAIPESEIANMVGILALPGYVLVATLEVEPLPAVGGDTLRPFRKSRRVRPVKQVETG